MTMFLTTADDTVMLRNTITGEIHAGTHGFGGLWLTDVTLEGVADADDFWVLLRMAGQLYDGGCLEAYPEPEYERVSFEALKRPIARPAQERA